jgi:hypothetical protein
LSDGKTPPLFDEREKIGAVLKCHHCDVLIYNPTHHHGTTEFSLYPDEASYGRLFFAFFTKKSQSKDFIYGHNVVGKLQYSN